jgi:hypothetical protein
MDVPLIRRQRAVTFTHPWKSANPFLIRVFNFPYFPEKLNFPYFPEKVPYQTPYHWDEQILKTVNKNTLYCLNFRRWDLNPWQSLKTLGTKGFEKSVIHIWSTFRVIMWFLNWELNPDSSFLVMDFKYHNIWKHHNGASPALQNISIIIYAMYSIALSATTKNFDTTP